jgi:hypothetical protein
MRPADIHASMLLTDHFVAVVAAASELGRAGRAASRRSSPTYALGLLMVLEATLSASSRASWPNEACP